MFMFYSLSLCLFPPPLCFHVWQPSCLCFSLLVLLPLCCCCTSCFILVGDVLCLESVYFSQDSLLTIPTCVPTGTHTHCPVFWPSWLCFFVLHSVVYVLDSVLCILFVFLCIVNYLHSSFVSSFWSRSTSCLPHWREITAVSFLSLATDQVVVVVHLLQSYMTECKSVVAYLVQHVSRRCLMWSCSAVKTYLPPFLLSYHFSRFRSNQF